MDWMNFVTIVAAPAGAILATYIYKIDEKTTAALSRKDEEIESVRAQLGAWQLEVVRNYVTRSEIERLEARILAAIDKLSVSIEKLSSKEKD
jgi:hypothetical protein